jgi:hypothetical protein
MDPTLDEALLTAYLDGELTPLDRRLLEQRLADEPELRQRLTLLEETWHCLDLLEQESVDAEQIETTLKVVAVSIGGTPAVPPRVNQFGKWGIAALAAIAVFAVMFNFGKQSELNDPSFRLMVERFEMYKAVSDDGLELLQALAVKRVFLLPLPDGTPPIDPHEYEPHPDWLSHAFIRPLIYEAEEYGDAELYRSFYKNIEPFRHLPPEKSAQIRKLHRDIESVPQQVDLLLTLQNYYLWFKSLQSYERIAIKQHESLEDKVASIIALKKRLDEQQWNGTLPMPTEIIGHISDEESQRLADALSNLSREQQKRLLNIAPHQIINELKQSLR